MCSSAAMQRDGTVVIPFFMFVCFSNLGGNILLSQRR